MMIDKENRPLHPDPDPSTPRKPMAQSYLDAPLTTLLHPDPVSPHDLLEAYHMLSLRLRVLLPGPGEALDPLRTNAEGLVRVLKRDVERALVNPLPSSSPSSSSSFPFLSPTNQSSLSSSTRYRFDTRVQIVSLTPADLKRATDSVAVAHAALGLVSILFRFECLVRLFESTCPYYHLLATGLSLIKTAPDLQTLLHSIVSLISVPIPQTAHPPKNVLPTPSSAKTRALVMWVLRTQRLPAGVLDGEVVGRVLGGALMMVRGGEGENMIRDMLKVIYLSIHLFILPYSSPLSHNHHHHHRHAKTY